MSELFSAGDVDAGFLRNQIKALEAENTLLEAECLEQARLLGMGGSKEAALLSENTRLSKICDLNEIYIIDKQAEIDRLQQELKNQQYCYEKEEASLKAELENEKASHTLDLAERNTDFAVLKHKAEKLASFIKYANYASDWSLNGAKKVIAKFEREK